MSSNNNPLSINGLAEQVNSVISCNDALKFEQFINHPQIYCHESIIKVLSDILATNLFTKEQKIITTSSFCLIYQKRFCQIQDYDNEALESWILKNWNEYFTCMMDRNDDDFIDWPYIYNTINAVKHLIELICDHSASINFFIAKYNQTTFQGKLLLMHAIYSHKEVPLESQFLFIRQSIEDFVGEALNVILNLHQLAEVTPEMMVLENDTMVTLYEWITLLNNAKEFEQFKEWELAFTLAKNQSIITLLKQQLKSLIHTKDGKVCYRKSQKLVEMYDKQIIKETGSRSIEKMVEAQLQIKSYSISLLQFFSNCFVYTSQLVHFDTFFILSMAELLTPIFITELAQKQLLKQDYLHENHTFSAQLKQLTISIFALLKRTAQFIFLLEIYTQNQQVILYKVFYDYLRTTEAQIQAYYDDAAQFISYNENFVQIQVDDFCDTPKQACAKFMTSFFQLNNKALVAYMEFLAAALKFRVKHEESSLISQVKKKGYLIPQVDMIYAILTRIYFVMDQHNSDMLKFVYSQFLRPDIVFSLEGLSKSRLLFFLNYAYPKYFYTNPSQGLKYIQWTSQTKQNSQTEFRIVMELLLVAFNNGIPEQVWDFVNCEIERSNKLKIFELVGQLVKKDLDDCHLQCLLGTTKRICQRIQHQFSSKSVVHFLEHKGNQYSIFEKCFHILQDLSSNSKLIGKFECILQSAMDLVELMSEKPGIEQFEFSLQIVTLLNNIIRAQQRVPIEFQKYLPFLQNTVHVHKQLGPLLETYYLILLKAGQTFYTHPQFLVSIQKSLQHQLLNPEHWKYQPFVIETLFLLSNILLVYPELAQDSRELLLFSQNVLDNQKLNVDSSSKLCASIFIYWMAGEYAFGNYHMDKLAYAKIQIFTHDFGLMFALCLHKLILKYHQTPSLQPLLKLAIKLLDYELYYKTLKNYRNPKFTITLFNTYLKIDSFDQISSALEFLKKNLNPTLYTQTIDALKADYGTQSLSKLLSTRIIDNRKQRNILVVKKD